MTFTKAFVKFLSQSLLIKLIHYRIGQKWVASGREPIFIWIENWLRDKKEGGDDGCFFKRRTRVLQELLLS